MAQPAFSTSGDAPQRRDTRWFRWVRILARYQNRSGSNPTLNPSRLDTLRQLKNKVLKSIRRDTTGSLIPSGEVYVLFGNEFPVTPARSYTVIFGANDISLINDPDVITSTGPGDTQTFVANGATVRLLGIADLPITAQLYQN